jgi:uncharacterized protein (UPF0254 family)
MMDIQSSALNELFELYPLIIPGWVSPVKPDGLAHGGIPKALYDDQPQGLECLVDPWLEFRLQSWTMAVDDRVDVYVNDDPAPVTGKTVAPGEENQRIRLYIPRGRLIQGVNRLHYKVTRPGGNVAPSRDLLVMYHLRTPENLDLVIPPDVLKDGVSVERAAQGVEFGFTYANRRDYDRIEFMLGDTQVKFDVPDGTAPITHTLFTDTFQKAGDNPSAVAEFFGVDQLGNWERSPEKRLDIHLAVAVIVPTLTNVLDASDNEVPEGTSTTSTTLKLVGEASKGKEVEIYDGSGSSAVPKGKATADATTGVWELTITVPVGARRLCAKSLYHSTPTYSNVRTLTVTAVVVPTLTNVRDANNVEVPEGTSTTSTTLKLKGKASNGQQVEIFEGTGPSAISKGKATADPVTGDWELAVTVAPGARRFAAQSLYHSTPTYSNVRTLTVTAVVVPTLTNVRDANNVEVPEGTSTTSTTLKLKGKASNGQQVEIFEGYGPDAISKGKATAGPATGDWELAVTVAPGARRLYAQSLYHSDPTYSNVRTLTVTGAVAPTIDSVKGDGVEVPNGSETKSTTVILQGVVTSGQQVQIHDNNIPKHTVTAVGTTWTTTLGVTEDNHSITAKALSTGQFSNARSFRVISSIPPLTINTAHVSLSGWIFRNDPTPTNPPAGSFIDRTASGGVPPYRYTSSNPAVAEVNISSGRVISKGNGSAIITVSDGANQTASYPVSVSNVYRIFGTGAFNTYTECSKAAAALGGRIPSLAEWRSYISAYDGTALPNEWCWASDSAGVGKRWAIFPANGQTQALNDFVIGGQTAVGWGIR